MAEGDLPILYRLTSDPALTGEHEWYGWRNPRRYRRGWLEKAGFSREGVIRGAAFQGGRWHDAAMYSVLRPDVEADRYYSRLEGQA